MRTPGENSRRGCFLPDQWDQPVFYLVPVCRITGKLFAEKRLFMPDSCCNDERVAQEDQKAPDRPENQWHGQNHSLTFYAAWGMIALFFAAQRKEMNHVKRRQFLCGMRDGMPVCIGYFSVSFGFGAMAVAQGLAIWHAILISATNLTSAGQFAGLTVISAGAAIIEMILTQLVINSRYALMSLAIGQRLGPHVGTGQRLLAAFFNTDEIFALGMAKGKDLTVPYFVGAGTVAALGWTGGTAMGAIAGSLLPQSIRMALGVMLYGMFIAIVVPQTKEEKPILVGVTFALVFSCLFTWVPVLNQVSGGLAIVISTVAAASLCAMLFPVQEDEE